MTVRWSGLPVIWVQIALFPLTLTLSLVGERGWIADQVSYEQAVGSQGMAVSIGGPG